MEAGEIGGMPSYFMASLYPGEMGGGGGGCVEAAVPMDRALLASKNHREAEKRRRERIKSHLDRLRTILACDPKVCLICLDAFSSYQLLRLLVLEVKNII